MIQITIGIIIAVSLLLVLLVLAQSSKGGLTGGVSGATQLMGARRATDWIEKATWSLVVVLFVLCLGVNILFKNTPVDDQNYGSPNIQKAKQEAGADGGAAPEATQPTAPADTAK